MMKLSRVVFVIVALALPALHVDIASASGDAYVCSVRLETGFAKDSDRALPGTTAVKVSAQLNNKPYCTGEAGEILAIGSPALEKKRRRDEALNHPALVRNALQGILSSFLAFEIAAAQGSPLSRAITISTDEEAPKSQDYAFQATRPASVKATMPAAAPGRSGSQVSGYVCLARSRYRVSDDLTMPTVNDTHTFELRLYTQPFCLGNEVWRTEYEFGPAMRPPRKIAERLNALAQRVDASAVMHAIYVSFIEAAMAGQPVTLSHTRDGLIAAVELRARPRDLVNEVKTIAMPK